MRDRICKFDWSSTPIGPVHLWSDECKAMVGLCLGMKAPACIFWGQQGIQIYNDAYSKVMRRKHPSGLGQSIFAKLPEREQALRPMLATVLGGEAIFEEHQPWTLVREGELSDYTFSIAM